MKKQQLMAWPKLCVVLLLIAAALFTVSCAQDGFDEDESWEPRVRNQLLRNPTEDEIIIEPTVDRKQTKISWSVIEGASKYACKVYDVTDGKNELLKDSLVDGVDILISRTRNVYYRFTIQTIANTSLGNTSPEGVTAKEFDAKLEIYDTIDDEDHGNTAADPINLIEYFKKNPAPSTSVLDELVYNLKPNKYYSVDTYTEESGETKILSFENTLKPIMLRCEDESQRSNLILGDDACFVTKNSFTLEGLNITCGESTKPLITLSDSPDASLIPAKEGDDGNSSTYYRINAIGFTNCNIIGLKGSLIYDSGKQYCIVGLTIENVLLKLATDASDAVKSESLISLYGGGAKDFTITNSTVYQTGSSNPKYFLRYVNGARVDRYGYNTTSAKYSPERCKIIYQNNTFYKVCSGNWSNYDGLADGTSFDVKKNIWFECSGTSGEIARRMLGRGRVLGENCDGVWDLNTYVTGGVIKAQQNADGTQIYDTGTQLQSVPSFANADGGDFTITSGSEQLANQTGDSRWIK